jgi:hypothetical protein
MKTVIIYDQCGQEDISFAVVDRDVTHLAGIYVNNCNQDAALCDELCDMFYDDQGRCIIPLSSEFPVDAVKAGAPVITCGFLP